VGAAGYTPGRNIVTGSLQHRKTVFLEQGPEKRGYGREEGGI
jgi:hypothetical protein